MNTTETKPTHRAMLVLHSDSLETMSHDTAMAVVWLFLNPEKYWHKQEMKPFVWDVQKTGKGTFQFLFSSIFPSDTRHFFEAAQEKGSSFRLKDGTTFDILSLQYLPNLKLESDFVRVFSSGGCQCFRKQTVNNRRPWRMISAIETPQKFTESIANSIRRRANSFLPGKVAEDTSIRVRFVEPIAPPKYVYYKGGNIMTQFVTFKLEAPPEVQKVALYGGIGKEPSSGFGFVLPE